MSCVASLVSLRRRRSMEFARGTIQSNRLVAASILDLVAALMLVAQMKKLMFVVLHYVASIFEHTGIQRRYAILRAFQDLAQTTTHTFASLGESALGSGVALYCPDTHPQIRFPSERR